MIDGTGPRLKLKLLGRRASKGLRAKATLNEPARITDAKVKLSRKVAKKLRSRKRTLGGKATKRLAGGSHTLKIKLPRPVRRRGAGRKIKLDLRLVDALGNVSHKRFGVKLR